MSSIQSDLPLNPYSQNYSKSEKTFLSCGHKVTEKIAMEIFENILPTCPTCKKTIEKYDALKERPISIAERFENIIKESLANQTKKRHREEDNDSTESPPQESFKKAVLEKRKDERTRFTKDIYPVSLDTIFESSSMEELESSSLSSSSSSQTPLVSEDQLKDGEFHPEWTKTLSSREELDQLQLKLNGRYKVIITNDKVAEGLFKNNKLHGKGKITFAQDGGIFEGEFQDDRLIKGKITCKDNHGALTAVYEGLFENDKLNGLGKKILYYYDAMNIYEGNFKDDELNGSGKVTDVTISTNIKNIFVGSYINDCLNGLGKVTYSNGDVAEGMFKDDELNGQGTFTFANGKVKKGLFENNKFIRPLLPTEK